MKIGNIEEWEAFLAVATHKGFSQAAPILKTPVPQVSKRIAKLESQLGVRLFQRTTRVVNLTDEGKALLPKIHSILEDLREAESFFENKQELSGTVKITCPPFVAHRLVLPTLGEFMDKHPKIHLEFELSEGFLNIIDAGYDMAIRIETPKDSDLVYRRLAPNDLVFCASPAYLKKNPAPLAPKDLKNHSLLMLSIHRNVKFRNSEVSLGEFKNSKKLTCENGVFLRQMAIAAHGIVIRTIYDVREELEKGLLVQVLKKHPLETFGYLHAVVPNKRFLAPRVRAFMDFIVEKAKRWPEE